MTAGLVRPDPLEVAAGQMLGAHDVVVDRPRVERGGVRAALERQLIVAVQHDPCVVSFSGGRDSSALLALAADVARREGLPLPVAATLEFVGLSEADERSWQELVLRSVGIADWQRVVVPDGDLDFVGPTALRLLRTHGVVFPSNAHAHVPLAELGRGGSLVCGAGGDEVFGSPAEHLVRVLRGRARPRVADARSIRQRLSRSYPIALGTAAVGDRHWLRPAALVAAVEREGRAQAALGMRWGRALQRWAHSRYRRASVSTLRILGEDHGVHVVAPFLTDGVLAAVAADGGVAGYASRTDVLRSIVGELLPSAAVERTSKATFTGAFFGPHSRALVEGWDGTGVIDELVDATRVAAELRRALPDGRTSMLLQTLALQRDRSTLMPPER